MSGPVFSTMTSVIAPALLLPPLVLLVLASSANKQVDVVLCSCCSALPTRRRRQSSQSCCRIRGCSLRVRPLAGGVGSPLLRQLQQCSVCRYLRVLTLQTSAAVLSTGHAVLLRACGMRSLYDRVY